MLLNTHTIFSEDMVSLLLQGGKTSDFSVSPIRLSLLEQGAETFGAENSGKASPKRACHDFTGFCGETHRSLLAVVFELKDQASNQKG